jgi:UDP-glucose 4-epimerase
MKWLITGGCGFIGSSLIRRLRDTPSHCIRVIDNLSVGTEQDLARVTEFDRIENGAGSPLTPGGPTQLLVGDIRDSQALAAAVDGVEVIVHLAANTGVIPSIDNPLLDCETNVIGTVRTLEAARAASVERFVLASSGAPLGAQEPPIHEEKVPRPVSPYGASKLSGEAYCSAYHGSFGLKTVAFRFGNVYGPGSTHKGSVVAKFIKQAMAGETVTIFGDGSQTRDFIYIEDLVDALVLATKVERGGEIFQIATGGETTVNEVAELLKKALVDAGLRMDIRYDAPRAGEVIRNYSDISKAKSILGWEPRRSLEQGLAETVKWFIEQRSSNSGSRG